ncbi:MAG: TolC family outer membrane protein [Deltaproteobacteria bacterium]|nr:TolC family outer membrane protein [Deltaproteobacteria bacterium]
MNSISRYVGTLLLVILVWGIWGAGNSQSETLQDAVGHMLFTNPEVRAIGYNRLAREEEVKQAVAGYGPILDISTSYGVLGQDHPVEDHTWPRSTKLTLQQNVFRGFADRNEIERQKARVNSAAYRMQGTSENIALVTSRVYLNVLRQLEILELAKENLATHQRIYDQIKLRSESGIDRGADLDQVMGRMSLAKSDVVVAEANLADAETDYQLAVGRLPVNLVKPNPVDSVMPASLDEAQQSALNNYPILKSAQADLEARQAQYRVAQSNYYPKLDLIAEKKWEEDVDIPGYEEELLASAVLRYNIFNGFKDKARIAETCYLVKEAREIQNNTHREVIEAIRLSWVAYQSSQNRIISLKDYVKSTGATAEAFSKQWNIGRRTMFDVLDIEAELINAKIDLVNTYYDYVYSQYRILSNMGQLVHTLGLQWPKDSMVEGDQLMLEEEVEEAPALEKSTADDKDNKEA